MNCIHLQTSIPAVSSVPKQTNPELSPPLIDYSPELPRTRSLLKKIDCGKYLHFYNKGLQTPNPRSIWPDKYVSFDRNPAVKNEKDTWSESSLSNSHSNFQSTGMPTFSKAVENEKKWAFCIPLITPLLRLSSFWKTPDVRSMLFLLPSLDWHPGQRSLTTTPETLRPELVSVTVIFLPHRLPPCHSPVPIQGY